MNSRPIVIFFLLTLFCLIWSASGYEQDVKAKNAAQLPREMRDIGIDPQLGSKIDLDLTFRDESGKAIQLKDIWGKGRPVILSLVYFGCPSLCTFHLNGLVDVLKKVDWQPGEHYDVVAVSIDPSESHNLAAAKKEVYLESFGTKNPQGWHFLTGDEASIKKLAAQVGFKYKWVESTKEWAHASAAILSSDAGVISRYLNGVLFEPRDMRLAINEASMGKIGTVIDQLILFCFQFDPEKNKYSLYAFNVMRAGGGVTVVLLLFLLIPAWFRSNSQRRSN